MRAAANLKYHLRTGNVLSVARGLYAVVPPKADASTFVPDRFLLGATARPDACFCYHAALELLGLAHSTWTTCTVFTARRHPTIEFRGQRVRFLANPVALEPQSIPARLVGVNDPDNVDRRGDLGPSFRMMATTSVDRGPLRLRVTGRERTLVEGLREPDHVGGLNELLDSFVGVKLPNIQVLTTVLDLYHERFALGRFRPVDVRQSDMGPRVGLGHLSKRRANLRLLVSESVDGPSVDVDHDYRRHMDARRVEIRDQRREAIRLGQLLAEELGVADAAEQQHQDHRDETRADSRVRIGLASFRRVQRVERVVPNQDLTVDHAFILCHT